MGDLREMGAAEQGRRRTPYIEGGAAPAGSACVAETIPSIAGQAISFERGRGEDRGHRRIHDRIFGWAPLARLLRALDRRVAGRQHNRAFHHTDAGDSSPYLQPYPALELTDVAHPDPNWISKAGSAEDEARLARLISPLCGPRTGFLAATLLQTYGSLPALLRSNRAALTRELPGEPELVNMLVAVRPLIRQLLRVEMLDRPALPNNRAALDYLFVTLAHETAEQVRILYLDSKNRILAQEMASQGSVTKADIFPREILRRALELGATGLIMAHNHPSGDPEPSRCDLQATRAVAEAARLFDIDLHDHIIIGRSGSVSLRAAGYL